MFLDFARRCVDASEMSQLNIKLPPRDIVPPRSLFSVVLLRMFLPALIFAAVVTAVGRSWAIALWMLVGIGLAAILLGIELPLILRVQRRRRQAVLHGLPPDAIYQCRARARDEARPSRFVDGTLYLDSRGATFTPKHVRPFQTKTCTWAEVTRISLRPAKGSTNAGLLVLTIPQGGTLTFRIVSFGNLAEILNRYPERGVSH
jgi:hypothetical protein